MTASEYLVWLKDKRRFDASLPEFHRNGFKRTLNVLRGNSTKESYIKWRSFAKRHGASYMRNPTYKQAIALRNWGYMVEIPER